MCESTWKNGENSTKNKPSYSSVEWNMLESKTHDLNADDEHGCRSTPCVEKNACANMTSQVECDINQ